MAEAVHQQSPSQPKGRYLWDSERFLAPLFFLPTVIFVVVLVGIPFALAIIYAFSDITTGSQGFSLVGLENFRALLQSDVFWTSLSNSLVFTFGSLGLTLILSTALAEVFTRDFKGKWTFRFLFLLPWTTPIALGAIGWEWMLHEVYSPYDWLLRQTGLLGHPDALFGPFKNMYWLGLGNKAMVSVILVNTWRVLPLATVIVIAGMTSIPKDIEEQSKIDGAGYWMRLFQINVPMMLPVLAIAVLFAFVFIFTDMSIIYVLTQGGPPPNQTQIIPSWAFFKGIQGGNLGQGAAVALFLFPVLAGVAALALRLARRSEVT